MRKIFATILSISTCCSFSAFADLCSTQSKGIYFVSFAQGPDAATTAVLSQCQNSPVTNNSECSNNLACGWNARNPYSSGTAVCYTGSHNIAFQTTGDAQAVSTLTQTVLSQCQQAGVTNNSECSQNVACGDYYQGMPYPSGQVLCYTTSHSISFRQTGDASLVTAIANQALSSCQLNSVTNNTECSNNLACIDAGNLPAPTPVPQPAPQPSGLVTCSTFSHNINFRQSGPRAQIDQVTVSVLSQCQQNPVTNNSECSNNLRCD